MSLATLQPGATLPGLSDPEWAARRRKGLGASEAPMALGVSPYGTPIELYLRKTGRWAEPEVTEAMELGLELEPVLARLYQRRSGRAIRQQQVFVGGTDRPHLLATLDAVNDRDEPVEFKTISAWKAKDVGEEGTDDLPEHWIVQAHQQMYLWGASGMDFAVLVGGQQFKILRVERHEAILHAMLPRLDEFWRCVVERIEPEWAGFGPVPDPKVFAALYPGCSGEVALDESAAAAADHWQQLGKDIQALHDERDAAKAYLLSRLGEAAYGTLPDGRRIKRSVTTIAERVQTVKGFTRVDLRVQKGR